MSLILAITGKTKEEVLLGIESDIQKDGYVVNSFPKTIRIDKRENVEILIRERELRDIDIKYWNSYGIDAKYLKDYKIYPIDYYWINGYRIKAEELAYAYSETIGSNIFYKIYQPHSQKWKWSNNYPKNTISLERYIQDKPIIICSSVKDALCLKHNIEGIDVCALQGEGYEIPQMFLDKYKDRQIFILFDNDKAGIEYSSKLSEKTNIPNIIIPEFIGGKDISDYYKCFGKDRFQSTFKELIYHFINNLNNTK